MIELQSYFSPVSSALYADRNMWETNQVGRVIDVYVENHFPDVKFAEIAIFNVSEYEGSKNKEVKRNNDRIAILF